MPALLYSASNPKNVPSARDFSDEMLLSACCLIEASVGFLGLGVQPPTPTLGNLIGEGRSFILLANWLVLYPGLVIGALVIGCNLIGDWLVRRADSRNA